MKGLDITVAITPMAKNESPSAKSNGVESPLTHEPNAGQLGRARTYQPATVRNVPRTVNTAPMVRSVLDTDPKSHLSILRVPDAFSFAKLAKPGHHAEVTWVRICTQNWSSRTGPVSNKSRIDSV
jgi:hypothetical protein